MRLTLCIIAALMIGVLAGGCVTHPKVDWNTRIGKYSYDQAVMELGVPDKFQKLSDNSMVAEWALRHYSPDYVTYGYSGGYWGHGWVSPGVGYGYPTGPDYTRWLRLVFGPDGKLTMHKEYDR
jgi:hypothetical protein